MYTKINQNDFHDAFIHLNRETNFTYAGRDALYDYVTELEEDIGNEIELDVIAICCEYTEYADLEEFKKAYPDIEVEEIDDISDYTTVIRVDDESFIIQEF